METYYSNGKLLITGEYLVMHGALALAVPTRLGQEMQVHASDEEGILEWESYYQDECWFEAAFDLEDLRVIRSSNKNTAKYLLKLLREAHQQNPGILHENTGIRVVNKLEFRQEWGMGSSSSLINNLAGWFGIDPFVLFFNTQSGSGFDIACARAEGPIWYRKILGSPLSQKVNFSPKYRDKLAFVYSGRKQDSEKSIDKFIGTSDLCETEKDRITEISREIASAKELNHFMALMEEHEAILSEIVMQPRIQEKYPSFPGSLKSLGAWGGDFILAASEEGFEAIKNYFEKEGLDTVLGWEEIVRY